ncbi:MAG: hypothetical protein ABI645_01265 [Pseudomonadota bacterium]
MTAKLDDLLGRLRSAQADRSLDAIESEVLNRISASRRHRRAQGALAPVQLATVGLSLLFGLTVGAVLAGTAPSHARTTALFDSVARLAPSTLLEGHK